MASVVVASAVALATLAGCASTSDSGGLSLQEIKSPIQLLRNEVANRVPTDVIDGVVQPTDAAIGCKSTADDPNGDWLTWQSKVLILIKYAQSSDMTALQTDLAKTFRAQGWTQGIASTVGTMRLKKTSSLATIDVTIVEPDKHAKIGGQLSISVTGPCVQTAGKDSDEVKKLEGIG